jgi:hypothetical protein
MLRGPHGVIPKGVAVLGVCEEVGVDPPVVGLAVVPLMRGRPLDTSVRHVHGPVEEDTKMHRSLQGLRACAARASAHMEALLSLWGTTGLTRQARPECHPCPFVALAYPLSRDTTSKVAHFFSKKMQ